MVTKATQEDASISTKAHNGLAKQWDHFARGPRICNQWEYLQSTRAINHRRSA